MKRYVYLIAGLLAATTTPALAAEARSIPASTSAAAQREADGEVMSAKTRQTLTRLREMIEAHKQAVKQAALPGHQESEGLCSDCPDKDVASHRHSVSEERKVDCIECVERAVYA